jgi:hypothetical protein
MFKTFASVEKLKILGKYHASNFNEDLLSHLVFEQEGIQKLFGQEFLICW